MRVGLIGGVGPAATVTDYRRLTSRFAVAGRRLDLTIVNADVREMTANLEAGRAAEQAAVFADQVDRLRAGGCDAAALTSMGGHFCFRQLEARSSLPLLSAIPALEAHFGEAGVRRVGVLGTRAVMESGLYGIQSAEAVAPPAAELQRVHDAYVAIARAAAATAGQRAFFLDVGRRLHRDQGVDVVVLGGTDLSLAFDGAEPDYPIADAAFIHADAIADAAMADR